MIRAVSHYAAVKKTMRPLEAANVVENVGSPHGMTRTDRGSSRHGDSHLGHVFSDGPRVHGPRYCMNPACLRFVHRNPLESERYGEYVKFSAKQEA
ncbi:peptide-methionine (R)-S-oxide reductase [Bradyrhizobium liaoningense]|uniref:peptide-methionine (R)-S-oxide reductase n=1 Tax=Bradyrhizobium liaoningense TaxID=43992 RepID=UPI001BA494C0|nr:peptide-methionine (R)-S-oxide reductase [Bradyrhizobium liaoningense]MBR0713655.1 peptide-methionine (R)-S-oxide reductase [Bradyrhizobium liaoningense]